MYTQENVPSVKTLIHLYPGSSGVAFLGILELDHKRTFLLEELAALGNGDWKVGLISVQAQYRDSLIETGALPEELT